MSEKILNDKINILENKIDLIKKNNKSEKIKNMNRIDYILNKIDSIEIQKSTSNKNLFSFDKLKDLTLKIILIRLLWICFDICLGFYFGITIKDIIKHWFEESIKTWPVGSIIILCILLSCILYRIGTYYLKDVHKLILKNIHQNLSRWDMKVLC